MVDADAARRGHLGEAGIAANCCSSGVATAEAIVSGLAPGVVGRHDDGREIDLRQRRDRQQVVGADAEHQHAQHQQRGRDRPADEGFGDVHRRPLSPTCWARRAASRSAARPGRRAGGGAGASAASCDLDAGAVGQPVLAVDDDLLAGGEPLVDDGDAVLHRRRPRRRGARPCCRA